MPIPGITQPEIIVIDNTLRLRKFDSIPEEALGWYQDTELVYLVDGVIKPYTREKLENMYRYLDQHGELYIIEAMENGTFLPIGDVSLWQEDLPIVIGDPRFRGRGIGRLVIGALIQRGRDLGWDRLYVNEIYRYNVQSRRCFESQGFRIYKTTDTGNALVLQLK